MAPSASLCSVVVGSATAFDNLTVVTLVQDEVLPSNAALPLSGLTLLVTDVQLAAQLVPGTLLVLGVAPPPPPPAPADPQPDSNAESAAE